MTQKLIQTFKNAARILSIQEISQEQRERCKHYANIMKSVGKSKYDRTTDT